MGDTVNGSCGIFSSLPPIPEFKSITIPLTDYNLLSGVKQAYEKSAGESITWEAFLIRLLGLSLK